MPQPITRVLIADDIAPMQRALARVVGSALGSVEIAAAADGAQVLSRLIEARDQGAPFDLLLADIGMPRWSGAGLLLKMRERDLDTPVVFCTGRLACPSVELLEHLGFEVLFKPLDASALRNALVGDVMSAVACDALERLTTPRCQGAGTGDAFCTTYCGAANEPAPATGDDRPVPPSLLPLV